MRVLLAALVAMAASLVLAGCVERHTDFSGEADACVGSGCLDLDDTAETSCKPSCQGKECGDDGCGGICGKCPKAAPYCVDHECKVDCEPDCSGKECGDDGCGGTCSPGCGEGLDCLAGQCQSQSECGDGTCSGGEDYESCPEDCNCVPGCLGKVCGSDGCGGSCGSCSGPETCMEATGMCVPDLPVCTPECPAQAGLYCAEDNVCACLPGLSECGNACCDTDSICSNPATSTCCEPNCSGKQCGADGCGGDCGKCPGPQDGCVGGLCQCQPSCQGKECGDDGCGASCGSCTAGAECKSGTCSVFAWVDPVSSLMWQNPPAGGTMVWSVAKQYCLDLNLGGFGNWRLPTIGELRSLIRGCPATELFEGTCGAKDTCLKSSCWDNSCSGCTIDGGPSNGCYWPESIQGGCSWYWSSSPVEDYDDNAWDVDFGYGNVVSFVGNVSYVRCVR